MPGQEILLGKSQVEHYIPPYLDLGSVITWIDGKNASFICRVCKTSFTPTAITYDSPPLQLHDAVCAKFNGTTSKVDLLAQLLGTGDLTIVSWVNPAGWGGGNAGRICDNGKAIFALLNTNSVFRFSSDGSTYATAATSAISLSSWAMLAVTRVGATGVANLYVNGGLSGSANQASGTPANGTTNLIIGNASGGGSGFNGYIGLFIAFNRILTASDIGFIYNNSLKGS